ncbi:MAG: queuosine precursor transporter [Gammaproteobacteria bacterium]
MAFVSFLLIANVQGPKLFTWGPFILPVSIFVFPMTYVLSVAITEVYGYLAARRVIWFAFFMNLVMALSFQVAIQIPAMEEWMHQEAYATVLGFSSRVVAASLTAYFVSEFLNAYLVSKLKVKHQGRNFWLRAILSMSIAEALGTFVVITLAFAGTISFQAWWHLLVGYYCFKVTYAVIATPILARVVKAIKAREQVDVFDSKTNFNPFGV